MTPRKRKTVDPKCYELAKHFLQGEEGVTEGETQALAEDIQSLVEEHITYRDEEEFPE